MTDFEVEQRIRAAAALRIGNFDSWVTPAREGDSFAEIPWLDIVTAASVALLAVDKNLKAAEGIIARLSHLYGVIVKKEPQVRPSDITLSERVIVLLADNLARSGSGLSPDELAAETLSTFDNVVKELSRLETLSVAENNDNSWRLRMSRG